MRRGRPQEFRGDDHGGLGHLPSHAETCRDARELSGNRAAQMRPNRQDHARAPTNNFPLDFARSTGIMKA